MERAIQDGDNIRAVIRNTGANQDGKTNGITVPSTEAQANLIRSVYSTAGLDPIETDYIEAHGTGTAVGDPIEAKAISSVFAAKRTTNDPILVGSVKSNIGHLGAASGLAAVVKTIFALEEGVIPPNINFDKPNEGIPLEKWKLKVSFYLTIFCQFLIRAKRFRHPQPRGPALLHGVHLLVISASEVPQTPIRCFYTMLSC